jgi:hypothetical protein
MTPFDKHSQAQCFLCSGDNLCARVKSSIAVSCWCQQQTFSPQLIKQAKQSGNEDGCICQQCAQSALTQDTPVQNTLT